jgi:hypothetical protein
VGTFPSACLEFVIPAKVLRQAQDPEVLEGLAERAGIQKSRLDSPRIMYGAGCGKHGMTGLEENKDNPLLAAG